GSPVRAEILASLSASTTAAGALALADGMTGVRLYMLKRRTRLGQEFQFLGRGGPT
ncbi:MAG: hypothetical protein ACI9RY_001640, partial [Reinekea sp.]